MAAENSNEVIGWFTETVVNWNLACSGLINKEQRTDLHFAAGEMLFDLMTGILKKNTRILDWKNAELHDFANIIFVHAFHDSENMSVQLGMAESGFYLQVEVVHPEFLNRMGRRFWQEWVTLSSFGEFRFEGDECSEKLIANSLANHFSEKAASLPGIPGNLEEAEKGSWFFEWPFDKYSLTQFIDRADKAFSKTLDLNEQLLLSKEN
jgi:hypothetical protein